MKGLTHCGVGAKLIERNCIDVEELMDCPNLLEEVLAIGQPMVEGSHEVRVGGRTYPHQM